MVMLCLRRAAALWSLWQLSCVHETHFGLYIDSELYDRTRWPLRDNAKAKVK
jgi:hypothetical protein